MPSNHLILCHPLLLLPSIFPSIRVFSNESTLHIKWPKYLSFSFSINPFNEYSGLISFRIDWLDFLAVQGTLKSLLQHHSLKTSILWSSAFFIVQFSHPYMITGKTIALTVWIFVNKVMSLLFNMLSSLGFSCSVGWWFWSGPDWLIWAPLMCLLPGWLVAAQSKMVSLTCWQAVSWFGLGSAGIPCFFSMWPLRLVSTVDSGF